MGFTVGQTFLSVHEGWFPVRRGFLSVEWFVFDSSMSPARCYGLAFAPAGRDVYSKGILWRLFALIGAKPAVHFAPLERGI